MTLVSDEQTSQSSIVRTERGLTIAGTRITLYLFMDHLCAGHSPESFRQYFPQITDEQFNVALSYIEANRAEVEAEYQIVLMQAEERRQYWQATNRERIARIAAMPPKPGQEVLRAKLQACKANLA